MSYLGSWKLEDVITFCINTHTPATGAATDADTPPLYRVYEDETTTPIASGSMALLDGGATVGFYSEQLTLAAASGFEKGKSYNIYVTATVGGVTGTLHHNLQLEAEVDANRLNWANIDNPTTAQNLSGTNIDTDQVVASVTGAVGSVGAGGITAASIATGAFDADALAADAAAEIADAVWDEDATGHQTGGTFGQAIGDPASDTTTIYQSVVTDAAGANIAADIIDIEGKVDDIGTAGAGLTAVPWNTDWDAEVQSEVADALGVYDPPTQAELVSEINSVQADIAALNNLSAAQVNAEVDAAIETYHLDHLFAVTYDPASKPGAADAWANELVESDGGVTRYTANALEQAPNTNYFASGSAALVDAIVNNVWDEPLNQHLISGSTGAGLNAAGSAGDPWATSLPGAYGAGTAGNIVGNNLDATVSSRASQSSVNTIDGIVDDILVDTGTTLQSEVDGIQADTEDLQSRIGTPSNLGSGATVAANLADIEGQTDDIGVAGAGLTAIPDSAGVTTLLSRITSTLFANITSLAQWLGLIAGKQAGNSTARTELRATGAGSGTFDETTDSQEALRDRGDSAWVTATGFSTLTQADVRSAVGLASANLDTQLNALPTAGENADAVWDETTSGHTTSGTFGEQAKTDIDAILADTGTDGVIVATNNDKTGYRLSATGVDDVLDEVVEGSITFRQMLRLFGAALGGELSGAATTTITIRNASDSKNVIVATVDADGNRSAVALDLT